MTNEITSINKINLTAEEIKKNATLCVQPWNKSSDADYSRFPYLDLEAYIRVWIDNEKSFKLPIAMYNSEIMEAAYHNTRDSLVRTTMCEMLGLPKGIAPDMDIVTNRDKMFGASALLFTDIFEDYCKQKGVQKIYILPSSIHELILLPDDDCFNPSVLTSLVRKVNANEVQEADILSDHAYIYDLTTDVITY